MRNLPSAQAQALAVLSTGATYRQDHLITRSDGSPLWLRVTGTALDSSQHRRRDCVAGR